MIYPDLDTLYKQHSGENHLCALRAIFQAGFSSAPCEFDKLQKQYNALLERYEALNAKFNVNQFHEPTDHARLIEQVMGMGGVFQIGDGYEQRS